MPDRNDLSSPSGLPPTSRPPVGQPSSGPDRLLATLLDEAEVMLRARGAQRCGGEPETRQSSSDPTPVMAEIELRVRAHPTEAARLAAQLGRVRAAYALQMREIPDEALQGLYDDIRAGLAGDGAWLRAGMSEAFLDAPNALIVWRRVAVAACLVLAVGAGYLVPRDDRSGSGDSSLRVMELRHVGAWDAGVSDEERSTAGSPSGRDAGLRRRVGGAEGGWAETVAHGSRPSAARPRGTLGWRVPVRRDSARGGRVYLFRSVDEPADARRMLDGIRIFPVPARGLEEGEDN